MTEEEEKVYYEKLYPFNYLTLQEFETTASSIERVYHIEELTGRKEETSKSRTMEAVVLFCRYLEDQAHVALQAAVFVDCMGCGGETCLYASAFHFKKIISIELTERSQYTAIRAISAIKGLPRQCTILCGTVKDYFPYDADVYYYDLLWVSDGRTWVDESVLIDSIFRLCEGPNTSCIFGPLTVTNDIKAAKITTPLIWTWWWAQKSILDSLMRRQFGYSKLSIKDQHFSECHYGCPVGVERPR